jgi:hypothetical protein
MLLLDLQSRIFPEREVCQVDRRQLTSIDAGQLLVVRPAYISKN